MRKENEYVTSVLVSSEIASSLNYSELFSKLNSVYTKFLESQKSFFKLQHFPIYSNLANHEGEFKMMTIDEHNRMEKINASLISSLLNDNFPCFAQFTKEEKRDFFGPFAMRFISLHRCYLTSKYFPNEEGKVAFHYGYYCSNDLEGIKHCYGDIPETEKLLKSVFPAVTLLKKTSMKIKELEVTQEEVGRLIALMYCSQCK